MGEIVGSALVAHVPPLVLPKDVRLELNHGRDFSIVDGLHRMRRECIDPLHADTIVVLDEGRVVARGTSPLPTKCTS